MGVLTELLCFQKQQVNHEEVLLNVGQVSSYPQIQELISKKEPFDKLWRTAVDFYAKYDQWMNGPLLNVNAEIVEEEVSIYLRQTYSKLTCNYKKNVCAEPIVIVLY